jgi:hypothetical protein
MDKKEEITMIIYAPIINPIVNGFALNSTNIDASSIRVNF